MGHTGDMGDVPDFAFRRDVPLAPFTTFGIGGPAELLTEPQTPDELAAAVSWARRTGTPWQILGLGANVLISDGGIPGLVIVNRAGGIEFTDSGVTAGSGVTVAELITESIGRGRSGFEHYINIPSTVGGALWQNLHFLSPDRSRTVFIEEIVESAELLKEDGSRVTVDRDYFEFGYDDSILHHRPDVVLSATFSLTPAEPAELQAVADANAAWRAEKHPPGAVKCSAGSIFRKIEGIGAGRLIDQAGLKGYRIGGAEVSERHANYIINVGGATAADVRALIEHVRTTVRAASGHDLVPEIGLLGRFD